MHSHVGEREQQKRDHNLIEVENYFVSITVSTNLIVLFVNVLKRQQQLTQLLILQHQIIYRQNSVIEYFINCGIVEIHVDSEIVFGVKVIQFFRIIALRIFKYIIEIRNTIVKKPYHILTVK